MNKDATPSDVDLRGFAWPGARLRPQLETAAQRALAELAARERHRAECEARLQAIRGEHWAHLAYVQSQASLADVTQRHRRLLHLSASLQRVRHEETVLAASGRLVAAAREAQLAAQRRLDGMERLEQMALADYAGLQRRRAAAEADRAWLARLARARGRRTGETRA